jgi:dTDP-4-amino-4,6-dideoxy-D-galactose acyltransferase
MNPKINKLDWDSNFFNFNVGKIEGSITNFIDLQTIEGLFKKTKTRLAYYLTPKETPPFVYESDELDFYLVDKKTTYTKSIDLKLKIEKGIETIGNNTNFEKLKKLAIQSGIYSRFKTDKKINKQKFEELYRLWIENSINKKIAKEVLLYKYDDEIAGLVTLGEKDNRADIGIIAVDSLFRGKGVGRSLMNSAEKWFSINGYKTIQVVTQKDNIAACKLYESCGYSVESVYFYYHIWKK